MSSTVTQLADLLGKTRRPGDFYARGKVELLPPSLSVQGVGPIALPLLPGQAEQLAAAAEQAPYGRGPDTIIDTAVRNTLQIGPDRVDVGGRHWPKTLATILDSAARGLGVSDPIEAEFYKMLIYEPGSFFVSHRDTEKTPGMFATLVIALPSSCSGGELVVRHKDRSVSLDLRVDDPAEVAFAAFYADCLHEVLPITAGYRVTLVYNLLRRGKGQAPQPPNYTKEQAQLTALLRDWCNNDGEDAPEKLVYPLEHAYTAPEFGFSILKGADSAAAGVLAGAAIEAGCALHLALVTLEEFGVAEYSENYGRRRRWSRDDDAKTNSKSVKSTTGTLPCPTGVRPTAMRSRGARFRSARTNYRRPIRFMRWNRTNCIFKRQAAMPGFRLSGDTSVPLWLYGRLIAALPC